MNHQLLKIREPLYLESGEVLTEAEIAYHAYGKLNEQKDNVVWVFHALTANSDAADWWDGLIGEGKLLDPKKHFIMCANVLGSCYGSTGPLHEDTANGKPYYRAFPLLSIRDMVQGHQKLKEHLGIERIKLGIGGSLGGQQLLEWAVIEPELFETIVPIATNAKHSPWGIAFNETQRWAIETDPSWKSDTKIGGEEGLKIARSIAMLSYRTYQTYDDTQQDTEDHLDGYRASTYQRYQGLKLSRRFNAYAYWYLSKAMDSQSLARNRTDTLQEALQLIKAKTIVAGITSDILFPKQEQEFLAEHIPGAIYEEIESLYGHDGFLLEFKQLTEIIKRHIDL